MPTASPSPAPPAPLLSGQCRDLPTPVQRYLARALGDEGRPVEKVVMQQTGMLRTSPAGERWLRFSAKHQASPQRRRFDWEAKIRLAPCLHLRVRDAYADGVGQARVSLWSWLRIAAERDVLQLNAGALHRFLAEAPWYPSALLPCAGVRWSAMDEHRALATLEDAGTNVSLEFRFSAVGEVESIYTPARWRRVGRGYQSCAWEGRFSDYRSQQGLRVPFRAEVGWHVDGKLGLVWRGEVTDVEYRFGQVYS